MLACSFLRSGLGSRRTNHVELEHVEPTNSHSVLNDGFLSLRCRWERVDGGYRAIIVNDIVMFVFCEIILGC